MCCLYYYYGASLFRDGFRFEGLGVIWERVIKIALDRYVLLHHPQLDNVVICLKLYYHAHNLKLH